MPVPHITTFLYCMGLETGAKIVGYIHMMTAMVLVVLSSVFANNLSGMVGTVEDQPDYIYSKWYVVATSVAVGSVVHVLLALLLLFSVHKGVAGGIRTWVVTMCVLYAAGLLFLAVQSALHGLSSSGSEIFLAFLEGLLFYGLIAYCILCVNSYYMMLKSAQDMEGPKYCN